MQKNVASQKIGCQMVSATDGSAFTGAVTVSVTGDAGTQATGSVGSGACTHEGNGYHTYAPAQAETNYDLVAFTFTGTGAVPATVQVYTRFDANVTHLLGTAWLTPGTAGTPDVNVKLISDDATAANNAESFFDGTGYAGTNNVIPTVTDLTNLPTIPANWLTAAGTAADFVTEVQNGLATPTNITAASGVSLASDGLDAIATTAPAGVATTFPGMVVQLWRRAFKKSTMTSTQIKTYADDGTTVVTTQTVSDDAVTQTMGAAS